MDRINRVSGSRGALEYGKFRKNSKGESVVATVDDSEFNVATTIITDSGNVEIIAAPVEGEALRIKGFQLSREGSNAVAISFREETDGELKYTVYLANDGDFLERKLPGAWALGNGRALNVYASTDCNVHITIEYEGPAESEKESESLADSMAVSEELAFVVEKAVTDTHSIAEELATNVGLSLSDELPLEDEEVYMTGDRSKALSGTMSISETLANQSTLSVSDAEALAESLEYTVIPG